MDGRRKCDRPTTDSTAHTCYEEHCIGKYTIVERISKYQREGMAREVLWKQVRRFEPIEFHYVTVARQGTGTRDVRRSGS